MAITKFELDKFNGENDFNLWRIKMKALLVHQGLYPALNKEGIKEERDGKPVVSEDVLAIAHSALILR